MDCIKPQENGMKPCQHTCWIIGFQRGMIDKTLFIKRDKSDILLVQVYVDDFIFGFTRKEMCTEFEKMMHKKFQMSSMRELTIFLGLQVKQKDDGIFISQDKYVNEILNKFSFSNVKTTSTPMETHKTLLKDEKGGDVDEHLYRYMIGSLIYPTSLRPNIMFVAITNVKNINGEAQLHARVDGKKVVISEASIKKDLRFGDEGDIDCLPNQTIFEQLSLVGYEKLTQKLTFYKAFFSSQWKFLIYTILQSLSAKTTTWNEFSSTIASAVICLATYQKFNFSKYIFDSMVKNLDTATKFLTFPRKTRRQDTELPQTSVPTETILDEAINEEMYDHLERATTTTNSLDVENDRGNISKNQSKTRFENVSNFSNDLPLSRVSTLGSGKDRLKLKELIKLCTKLCDRVLNLETTKTAQAKEIANLKKRIKRLE
nr:putative ribonuclease H-like domain-containing protein [Tanacetum cinerariifolium]